MKRSNTLNERQREAAYHKDGALLVLAGAGSGKTKVMIERIAILIDEYGINPNHILGVTFTNKAAQEMKERAEVIVGEQAKYVTLTTFHSFCSKLLRQQIQKVEPYTGKFTIYDSSESKALIKEVIDELKLDEKQHDPRVYQSWISYMKNELVNPKSASIISTWVNSPTITPKLEPYVDLSKSSRLFNKIPIFQWGTFLEIYKRYQTKLEKSNALDFDDLIFITVRLFAENPDILECYQDVYQYIMIDEYQDTNHAQYILAKLLAHKYKNIVVVGDDYQCLTPNTLLSTEKGQVPFKEITSDTKVFVGNGHGKKVLSEIEGIKTKEYEGKMIRITTSTGKVLEGTPKHITFARTKLEETKTKFENLKCTLNFQMFGTEDFQENIYKHKLNTSSEDREEIEVSNDYDYLWETIEKVSKELGSDLVNIELESKLTNNKFKFTSFSDVFKNMILAIETETGIEEEEVISVEEFDYKGLVYDINIPKYRNYIANGIVVHNCIYGFRNSDMRNILEFEKDYPNAKIVKLEQNYRSTQNILDAANKVISFNPNQRKKTLWTDKEKGAPINYQVCIDANAEANYVVSQIDTLIRRENYKPSDFCILYRVNAQSRIFEDALMNYGISYNIVGALSFYDRKEIKDVVAYLRFLYNSSDNLSLKRIINSPKRGIGNTTISKATQFAAENNLSLWDALLRSNEYSGLVGSKKLIPIIELFNTLTEDANTYRIGELVEIILDDTGYRKALEIENTEESKDRLENLQEFLNMAWDFQETNENPTLENFLEKIALVQENPSETQEEKEVVDKVKLMTGHGAKGLEFPVVFMVGLEENLLPYYRSIQENNIEEERRLCYVFITRAKERLYMTRARERRMYGNMNVNEPSRFLYEIGLEKKEDKKKANVLPW